MSPRHLVIFFKTSFHDTLKLCHHDTLLHFSRRNFTTPWNYVTTTPCYIFQDVISRHPEIMSPRHLVNFSRHPIDFSRRNFTTHRVMSWKNWKDVLKKKRFPLGVERKLTIRLEKNERCREMTSWKKNPCFHDTLRRELTSWKKYCSCDVIYYKNDLFWYYF